MDLNKQQLIDALLSLRDTHFEENEQYRKGYEVGVVIGEAMLEYLFIQIAKKKDAQGKLLHVDMFDEILDIRETIDAVRKI